MLLYRVIFYNSAAAEGMDGHPLYLYRPQGLGRWDNPHLYGAWYLATVPEGAVGETFGNIPRCMNEMLEGPGGDQRRALATFSVSDELSLFDFDDVANLRALGMRPSQVVIRNRAYTQSKAAAVFAAQHHDGRRKWAGVKWWSFHRPTWTNTMLWGTAADPVPLKVEDVEVLTMRTVALVDAARSLSRPLP
jgi:hypothetical protein